jgi:hypothetical protein
MVGFPSTMFSSPQHTPLLASLPIDSGTTSDWLHSAGPAATGDRIAENKGVMPVPLTSASAVLERPTA